MIIAAMELTANRLSGMAVAVHIALSKRINLVALSKLSWLL
jgi:hypothetical protein